ncbi:Syo1p RNJ42_01575 [Nakaseomyces bracarensis]|uniref:Syo1p n=1 Tax=Nakaseomyces bracarensis TaxID=273131 RepID=UPI003871536A
MGRSKKKSRSSASRLNPLANNNNNNNGLSKKDASLVDRKLQPLLKNLESVVPNDRSMALGSISVMCEDPHMRKLLLKQKLVSIITTKLLSDKNTEIVVEAYGLLRNLCLEEGYDVSVHLWRSEIWISILDGFNKLKESLKVLSATSNNENIKKNTAQNKESKRLLFDFAENLLSLVVALCNGSDNILEEVLKSDKLDKIFEVITDLLTYGVDKLPINLFNTILDVIYDFSTESFEFIEAISSVEYLASFIQTLPNLKRSTENNYNELTEVLAQGIYLQFLDLEITYEQANEIIHKVCGSINDINLKELEHDLSSIAQDEDIANTANTEVAAKIKEYTKKRAIASMKLQSIEIAIDLITAITEILAAKYEEQGKKKIPEQLQETLTIFVPHVFTTLADMFPSRILIGWNNLLWLYMSIRVNFYELPDNRYKSLWAFVKKEQSIETDDLSLKVGSMSVIWALLKAASLNPDSSAILSDLGLYNNVEFVNSVISEYKSTTDLELKQRCCGVLAALALMQGQIEINRIIGQFIIQELSTEKVDGLILVELTNFIFEIYSDGDFDYDTEVFVNGGFLEILKTKVAPNLKQQFKFIDRNKNPELKERATETYNMLDSFINYKATEKS